ncbi:ATP-binding protein [Natronomonas halophila]|nr:ATP-binding protein [Natronomonas halophila]
MLAQYDEGMLLGRPLTTDDQPTDPPVSLPPSLQPLHAAWFGKTGSGKSTSLINAILENHGATEGADILIDPKGDGMPVEYLRAHYAKYGDLDDVYYFDCTETLPAISFFDIRDQLADGIDRTTAVEDVVDHYIEILIGIMGRDRFEQAVRSPDIIKYLVKAMFDPVHGDDAFAHRDLEDAATRMHETRDAPPVVDEDLQRMLSGVAANSKRSFDELMQGVANRIEKIPLDDRLGQLFNHVPEGDDPKFDFREILDEDAVVIVDTGGLRPASQRTITLVLLSALWSALQRRTRAADTDDHPLVNLYLEEAASIATSGLLSDLLAQSRSFGLSITLAMQFPAQLRQADNEAYAEVLNNVSTIITGNVAVDDDLARRLATEDMPPSEVANRLRAIRRGQWFVSLPSAFDVEEPRPFLLKSAPLPPGHPDGDNTFLAAEETAFEAAFDVVRDRTRLDHGIDIAMNTRQATMERHASSEASIDSEPTAEDLESAPEVDTDARVDSALPYTKRLPEVVDYDGEAHALVCGACETRYDPTSDGMRHAIRCCNTIEDVDRDNIPICELNLKLSVDERRQSPYTDAQLRFLQAVYAAHQRRFDPELEYDLLYDSMVRLQEYVGVDNPEVQELLDADLLSEDCSYPHKLYTVTPEGREAANISHREGVAHGDGKGDLSESSLHVGMVELGRRYIEQTFVEDDDSEAVDAVSYHEVDDYRLDAAGLDADGEVVVTMEAERSNHDTLRAVPEDYDKMANHDPEAAIWVVKNRDGAHDVLDALNNPPEGEARVEKEYSRSSPPQQFKIDEPGLTDVFTFQYLRDTILE